jgi:hypothetical protein
MNSRRVRWVENLACIGEMKNAYYISDGIPGGKRHFGKPLSRACRKVLY